MEGSQPDDGGHDEVAEGVFSEPDEGSVVSGDDTPRQWKRWRWKWPTSNRRQQ